MIRRHPRPTHFPYTTLFRSSMTGTAPVTMRPRLLTRKVAVLRATSTRPASPGADHDHHRVRRAGQWPLDGRRSEEHTSELQSLRHLVCRLLLEKKNNKEDHVQNARSEISRERRDVTVHHAHKRHIAKQPVHECGNITAQCHGR